jgi:hypothetical protein
LEEIFSTLRSAKKDLNPGQVKKARSRCFLPLFQTYNRWVSYERMRTLELLRFPESKFKGSALLSLAFMLASFALSPIIHSSWGQQM